jgi:putative CocE/NonD family hydrolase
MTQTPTAVGEITIELDVPVPMRDGTVLRADVFRPAQEGRFPVLLSRGPYDKSFLWDGVLDFKSAVRAGYVVINQDTRGRFASDGEWLPWKYEREDGYDTVEWAASLPYANGRVGMFAASYLGSTQWSAAIAGAPHLAAIAPMTTWSDPDDGLMFRGGAVELGLNLYWTLLQSLGQYPKAGLAPEEMFGKLMATMGDMDAMATRTYWQLPAAAQTAIIDSGQPDIGVARALADPSTLEESRVSTRYEDIQVPALVLAGWYDIFLQGSLDSYTGMRTQGRTARLVVGPWEHTSFVGWPSGRVGEVAFGLGSLLPGGRALTDHHLGWYDHWLKDVPATQDHESGVLLFVMGANEWRQEADWPLERAQDTSLYLDEGSALTWDEPSADESGSAYTYDPADPVQTRGGHLVMSSEYPAGPYDQRDTESRDDVLVFTTPTLEEDLEITGRVRATLFASTDGPSTDWVVRLCEVDAAGVSRNIADGITRVTTEPGRIDEVDIDLWSTSILIRAGHRLRVHVTSSNFPRWDRNLNTGEPVTEGTTMRVAQQRIFHDRNRPSRITLPIVRN